MTTVLSLYFFGLIVSLSLHTRATKVPDVSVVRHVEWLYPHPRAILVDPTCQKIRDSISNASAVYAPGTPEYNKDMEHWLNSSTEYAACSVEPGNVNDVAIVMRILSHSTSPFAIKGGGHTANAGFSSTTGVQITMSRFSTIDVHSESHTVDLGTGLIWDDVYAKLVPIGINVLGARVTGIGVAGFVLGGGFSWLTNQHGLAVDTVVGFEIVLPSGQVLNVDAKHNSDLFEGLKGGLNNFGVVTKITLKTFPQTDVWGGTLYYDPQWDNITTLIAKWSTSNTDPKATILPTYVYYSSPNVSAQALVLTMFYNAPMPPKGLFDDFFAIQGSGVATTRKFTDFVTSIPSNVTPGQRGAFSTVSLQKLTPKILKVIQDEAAYYGGTVLFGAASLVSYDVEPLIANWTSYATPSAWPHDTFLYLMILRFAWPLGQSDRVFHEALENTKATIVKAAKQEGQDVSNLYSYPNNALGTDSLKSIYGPHVARLKVLAAKYDPGKVMTRTGGFIFQK